MAKRIIPTGIKAEEFHLYPAIVHAREDPIGCDRMVFHITWLTKRRPDGNQVVLASDMVTMAREEKEPDTPSRDSLVKSATARSMVGLSASRRRVTSKPKRPKVSAMPVALLTGLGKSPLS